MIGGWAREEERRRQWCRSAACRDVVLDLLGSWVLLAEPALTRGVAAVGVVNELAQVKDAARKVEVEHAHLFAARRILKGAWRRNKWDHEHFRARERLLCHDRGDLYYVKEEA